MIYKFNAYGHPNILGTHKTTLEFTKDKEVSLKGDCIIGINTDFELDKLKEFIRKSNNKKISITISTTNNKKIQETIFAEINPKFDSDKEFVIRKTDFISERTFATRADKSAHDMDRDLIDFLREKRKRISIVIKDKN